MYRKNPLSPVFKYDLSKTGTKTMDSMHPKRVRLPPCFQSSYQSHETPGKNDPVMITGSFQQHRLQDGIPGPQENPQIPETSRNDHIQENLHTVTCVGCQTVQELSAGWIIPKSCISWNLPPVHIFLCCRFPSEKSHHLSGFGGFCMRLVIIHLES